MRKARTAAILSRVRLTLLALVGISLLGGCAYYNGMYNTNRLAKSARKAERDGRTFEATSLWGQVITRADTLLCELLLLLNRRNGLRRRNVLRILIVHLFLHSV